MTLVPRNNNLGVSLFDNMFDDFFKDAFFTRNNSVKVMKTDIQEKDEDGNYIRRERYCGKCSRSFYVGDSIKEEDIKANFNNGILELTFPKEVPQKEEEMKYITID